MHGTRLALAGLGVLGLALLLDALVVSDEERVEEVTKRLIALADRGGAEAAARIRDAFADDYRGQEPRERIDRYLEGYVAAARVVHVGTGGINAFERDGELVVNLRVSVALTDGQAGTFLLSLTFAERDGAFRIVGVSRTWRS
ncbi:MAG: hypothetical protein ACE5JG_00500 [Planctomycetota bacterium]